MLLKLSVIMLSIKVAQCSVILVGLFISGVNEFEYNISTKEMAVDVYHYLTDLCYSLPKGSKFLFSLFTWANNIVHNVEKLPDSKNSTGSMNDPRVCFAWATRGLPLMGHIGVCNNFPCGTRAICLSKYPHGIHMKPICVCHLYSPCLVNV